MAHYQVQVQDVSTGEWINIKDLEVIAGQPVLRFDSRERLTLDQAEERHQRLAQKYRLYHFRVNREEYL